MAQVSIRDSSISLVMISPSIALHGPLGDMGKRFGISTAVGLTVTYKLKNNWMFSAEGNFIFGKKISEPGLFSGLTTNEGYVIGSDGFYGDIRVFERGYYLTLSVGKLFPVKKPNPNCGFFVQGGVGFMQHKIKIDDHKNSIPSLQDDYAKGYDRLTNGIAFREFGGYLYNGNNRLVNFYGGVEFVQGITEGRRSYNFDQEKPDSGVRLDMLIGLRIGWVIPLFKEAPDKFYTY
ncbi:hypothetical protein BH11BAC2_BH11BAC2_04930 [soil metagenome]